MSDTVPATRIRTLNDKHRRGDGEFVLYWMTASRRTRWNFALQHAVDICLQLGKPLVILEPLDVDYPWANERIHRFVVEGMTANIAATARTRAVHYPYVEPTRHAGRGLLSELSRHACVIVTDYYPAFFLPSLLQRAAKISAVAVEAVDTNGLIPLAAHGRGFTSARSYRAFVQRELRSHLQNFPEEHPLKRLPAVAKATIPQDIRQRWPEASSAVLTNPAGLAALPIDHQVIPVNTRGGETAGRKRLSAFVKTQLGRYAAEHNDPDADVTSRLSPYLHFGHISAHEVFSQVVTAERWTTRRLAARGGGAREGWWNVSDSANLFLDQLVVWRELALNGCEWVPDYSKYDTLPEWARETLESHASDRRRRYSFDELDAAHTRDDVWNAAQRQLKAEGWFHGYLRMLWGKKLLEWAPDPPTALQWMEALMNRYSLDGRDPVSYASFTWVLGRYDRPWPRRPVFGTVRYMSSASAKRKLRMKQFLAKYSVA